MDWTLLTLFNGCRLSTHRGLSHSFYDFGDSCAFSPIEALR